MALSREKQVGVKVQADPLTAETLAAADFVRTFSDASATPSVTRYERGETRPSLSKSAPLPGPSLLEISCTEEMAGGAAGTAAPWDAPLQLMGFERQVVRTQTAGPGPAINFGAGSVMANATTFAAATRAVEILRVDVPSRKFWYRHLKGSGDLAAGDSNRIISGPGAGTPFDINADGAAGGRAYRPRSENSGFTPPVGTAELREAGVVHRIISGACSGSMMLRHGEPPKLSWTMRGVMDYELDEGDLPSIPRGNRVANVPAAEKPIIVGDRVYPFTVEEYSAISDGITIDFGITVSPRPTISQGAGITLSAGYETGYGPARITDRRVSVQFAPDAPPIASFDFYRRWKDGAEFPLRLEVGAIGGPGGLLIVTGPKASFTDESFQSGDREGILTLPANMMLTGNDDDEIVIAQLF